MNCCKLQAEWQNLAFSKIIFSRQCNTSPTCIGVTYLRRHKILHICMWLRVARQRVMDWQSNTNMQGATVSKWGIRILLRCSAQINYVSSSPRSPEILQKHAQVVPGAAHFKYTRPPRTLWQYSLSDKLSCSATDSLLTAVFSPKTYPSKRKDWLMAADFDYIKISELKYREFTVKVNKWNVKFEHVRNPSTLNGVCYL